MLQSNGRPERLLVLGSFGSGKTNAYFKIAEWLQNTGSPAQMFVIDPDFKARLDPNASLPNVHIFDDLEHWSDYKAVSKKCRDEAEKGRGDWLVVEMCDKVWSAAQAGYVEMTIGEDIDDYYVQWRKNDANSKGGNPFNADWGKDWQAINRLYDAFMYNVTRFPGHVYMTTPPEPVRDDEKDKDILRLYGRWGIKPSGQKRLGHLAADCLLFTQSKDGWSYSQIRGTGRPEFKNEKLDDFVMSYLVGKAGWTL